MEKRVLNASIRSLIGKKVRDLRKEGQVPAVLYGRGIEAIPVQLEEREVSKMLSTSGGATLIDLDLGKETHQVLVRDIQRDSIRRNILHVDFLKVDMDILITAQVPVELVGEAPAVIELGGVLVTGLSEIEVEALPANLPDRITIDLEGLEEIDSSITVADLVLGEGVRILADDEETIARVIYEAIEEEEVEEEELLEEGEEPEVIDRGKREEGEDEAEEE